MAGYRTIVADPPWDIAVKFVGSGHLIRRAPMPYGTMTLEQIKALPVATLADDDACLYLWTVERYLQQSYAVADQWGFRVVSVLVWSKPPQGVHGGDFIPSAEFVLYCKRGRPKAKQRHLGTVFNWSRGAHSAKPEAFQDIVERVSPGPYLELFARRPRPGWDVWGDEAPDAIKWDAVAA